MTDEENSAELIIEELRKCLKVLGEVASTQESKVYRMAGAESLDALPKLIEAALAYLGIPADLQGMLHMLATQREEPLQDTYGLLEVLADWCEHSCVSGTGDDYANRIRPKDGDLFILRHTRNSRPKKKILDSLQEHFNNRGLNCKVLPLEFGQSFNHADDKYLKFFGLVRQSEYKRLQAELDLVRVSLEGIIDPLRTFLERSGVPLEHLDRIVNLTASRGKT